MKSVLAPLLTTTSLLFPLQVSAQTACFGRSYSPEHLAANPGQQVRDIRVKPRNHDAQMAGLPAGSLDIRIFFRDDPREFTAWPACFVDNGVVACAVDCDGGMVTPEFTDNGGLRLTTTYLRAETGEPLPGAEPEGGCGEPYSRSVADQGQAGQNIRTVFVLYPRADAECDWHAPW